MTTEVPPMSRGRDGEQILVEHGHVGAHAGQQAAGHVFLVVHPRHARW